MLKNLFYNQIKKNLQVKLISSSAKILRHLICLMYESFLKLAQAAQAAQSSSIITKANKYLKNLILSCLVIFVYLFIYMFLVRSAFSSISHSILKKTTKTIEYLASVQKNHAEQKVVFNTNEDRR